MLMIDWSAYHRMAAHHAGDTTADVGQGQRQWARRQEQSARVDWGNIEGGPCRAAQDRRIGGVGEIELDVWV